MKYISASCEICCMLEDIVVEICSLLLCALWYHCGRRWRRSSEMGAIKDQVFSCRGQRDEAESQRSPFFHFRKDMWDFPVAARCLSMRPIYSGAHFLFSYHEGARERLKRAMPDPRAFSYFLKCLFLDRRRPSIFDPILYHYTIPEHASFPPILVLLEILFLSLSLHAQLSYSSLHSIFFAKLHHLSPLPVSLSFLTC